MKKIFLLLLIFLMCAAKVMSVPTGPNQYSVGNSERAGIEAGPAANVSAVAGNITELVFNVSTITRSWQGYFGNISGKITLDDARNWTLYDWNYANPQGRVYATRITSVNWANIGCMDFYTNGSLYPNKTTEETLNGMSPNDGDGISQTFSNAIHPSMTIGAVSIDANKCNSTNLFVNGTAQTNSFTEVLLTDNSSNNSVIYTAIIENRINGFNNKTMDFEMIVAEDGHGNNQATPYYFWVELV